MPILHCIEKKLVMACCIVMLLSGCLDFETYSLSLNFKDKTGKAMYTGISSNASTADEIEKDFQVLIDAAYLDRDPFFKQVKKLSKELYSSGNKLNAKIVFQFKPEHFRTELADFGLAIDANGDYVFRLEPADVYISGNGQLLEQGPARIIKWPKTSENLEFQVTNGYTKDLKKTSLLPRWTEWKKAKGIR